MFDSDARPKSAKVTASWGLGGVLRVVRSPFRYS
jgi:hypothetical protein